MADGYAVDVNVVVPDVLLNVSVMVAVVVETLGKFVSVVVVHLLVVVHSDFAVMFGCPVA